MTAAALRELARADAVTDSVVLTFPTQAVEIARGRSAVKIPFGRNADGKMVSIDAVIRGLACQCFCSACDAPLVARKGEKNQHHFAHYVETENCAEARETALHKFAKELICEIPFCFGLPLLNPPALRLPDNLNLGQMQDAQSEQWLDGIRPDVLAQFDEPVAIEIRVAHPVPPEKLQKFVIRKLAALEIDLSPYRNADKNEDEWRDVILRTAHRFWLFPPAVVRAEIERRAREQAEQREREEQRERDREAADRRRREQEAERHQREIERRERRRQFLEQYDRRRETAEKLRIAEKERRFIEGLKICADTKWHLKEWERRKKEAALRRAPQ